MGYGFTSSRRRLTRPLPCLASPQATIHYTGRDSSWSTPARCTLYDLASLHALAAEVLCELLCLLARLGVDHDLAYRYPAVVADVGALVVVEVIMFLSGWVRGSAVDSFTSTSSVGWPGSEVFLAPAGPLLYPTSPLYLSYTHYQPI